MSKKKNKIGMCVYCGKRSKLTKDHIPPKNLYAKPRPCNLITVPCCNDCNSKASKDDEYFRLNVVMRDKTEGVYEAECLKETVFRSLKRKESIGFKNEFINRVGRRSCFTPAGIFTGTKPVFDVDLSRLDRVAKRTIAGIVFKELGERLPDSFDINVFSTSGMDNLTHSFEEGLKRELDDLLQEQYVYIGSESVFAFWHKYSGTDRYSSLWLLVFFRYTSFVGVICPKEV